MSSADRPSGKGSLAMVPWDARAFGVPCYEVIDPAAAALAATGGPGHYTVKVDPLSDKRPLHENSFYYCDTLIEPYCRPEMFRPVPCDEVTVTAGCLLEELLTLSRGAYRHGRYHRDFNIPDELADLRYDTWLRELHQRGLCFGLSYRSALAAYFATTENRVVLHAVKAEFRGRGLAKQLWSSGYRHLFAGGAGELASSVSAANLAVVNLYASLGFRFRHPLDVYHKYVPAERTPEEALP